MNNENQNSANQYKTTDSPQENFLLIQKQTTTTFFITEASIYLSQIATFFFVSVLTSNLLRDEKGLQEFVTSKINGNTLYETFATMISIAATLGIVAAIAKAASKTPIIERVADEVLSEIPRTAYIFGSSVTGMFFAVALFLQSHPELKTSGLKFFIVGAASCLVGFVYGCFFAYAFKHKDLAKSGSKKSTKNINTKITD